MSRAYRIRVSQSLKRDIAAGDEICSDLEILEILPADQMGALLKQELGNRGFAEQEGKMVRKDGDVTVTVDPTTGEVNIKAEAQEQVELEASREDIGYDDVGPGEEAIRNRLNNQLNQDLERRAEQQRQKLQQQATQKLEGHLSDLQKELGQAVNKVTAEALKQKAAQLGQIKEITEDAETGSLTIKVEV